MDIERIKSTALGRAWLSVFVRRVWDEVLDDRAKRYLSGETWRGGSGIRWLRPACNTGGIKAVAALHGLGLVCDAFKRLTPHGVEVYLHGRKQSAGGRRG